MDCEHCGDPIDTTRPESWGLEMIHSYTAPVHTVCADETNFSSSVDLHVVNPEHLLTPDEFLWTVGL